MRHSHSVEWPSIHATGTPGTGQPGWRRTSGSGRKEFGNLLVRGVEETRTGVRAAVR